MKNSSLILSTFALLFSVTSFGSTADQPVKLNCDVQYGDDVNALALTINGQFLFAEFMKSPGHVAFTEDGTFTSVIDGGKQQRFLMYGTNEMLIDTSLILNEKSSGRVVENYYGYGEEPSGSEFPTRSTTYSCTRQ